MLIGELPTLCARRYPNKNATVFRGTAQTFAEFNRRVNRLVTALGDLGLKPGDKVGFLTRNRPEALEIYFAGAKAGIVLVPINFRLQAPELRFVINDAEIHVLFVGGDYVETVDGLRDDLSVSRIFQLGAEYEQLLEGRSSEEPCHRSLPDDLFGIFYTSGTTGGPKGVMLTQENFLTAAVNHLIAYQLGPTDVCLHVMPFYHTMEASMAVCQFYVGGTNVIEDAFDPDGFWRDVEEYGVTHITLVYTMLQEVLDAYDRGGCSRGPFRHFSVGGQAVPVEVIRRAVSTLGEGVIFQVYGLTEASPLLTYLPKEDVVLDGDRARLLASVGKELFSCHVRVVDEDDRDVVPGQHGELIARGPNVMQGYWNRPQETAAALRDGWLRTGDVATVDEEGYIYIVDRVKDLIISGGENISPREVEDVLYAHPAVAEAAVIGIPDEKWGEQVQAVVVLSEGGEIDEPELIGFCTERLAKYKTPRRVVFVDSLPRDPVGKIQKRELREQYAG